MRLPNTYKIISLGIVFLAIISLPFVFSGSESGTEGLPVSDTSKLDVISLSTYGDESPIIPNQARNLDKYANASVIPDSDDRENISVGFYVNKIGETYHAKDGDYLINFMDDLMEKEIFSFTTRDFSGIGKFIIEINGEKEKPREGYYWTLYINEKESKVGVSQYKLKNGDRIDWILESRL